MIRALADRYRVVAPDYPDFGHNSVPPRDEFAYTFDNPAGVVEEFTAMLGRPAKRSRFPFRQGVAMATMAANQDEPWSER